LPSIVRVALARTVTVVVILVIGVTCFHHVVGINVSVAIPLASLTDSTCSRVGLIYCIVSFVW
jgi:hypothetical protein